MTKNRKADDGGAVVQMDRDRVVEVSSDSECSDAPELAAPLDMPVLLGSRAGEMHGVDKPSEGSDWDVVASLQWARALGPTVWQEEAFAEAQRLHKPFCTVKVHCRGTLLDLTVPVSETSFAARLLRVKWSPAEKVAEIGTTGEKAVVAPPAFLYRIKVSHVGCENSLDWEKHMRKLARFGKVPYDARVYEVVEAIEKQHRTLYGPNGEEIELPRREGLSAREMASLAVEFGVSLQSFTCRCQEWLWGQIVQQFDAVEKEYRELTAPQRAQEKLTFSHLATRLWAQVPSDVHGLIFKRLRAQDFRRMQTVCRSWKCFLEDEAVVRFIYQVQFGEPFSGTTLSKPLFVLEARESCGPLSAAVTRSDSPEALVKKCLAMRDALFVGHGLPTPRELKRDTRKWLLFVVQNVVIAGPASYAQGTLKGRELHETPRSFAVHAWLPGATCMANFNAGTEGSSQTSWEAIRLAVVLKSHQGRDLLKLDTTGIDLFGGEYTRYGEVYSDGRNSRKRLAERLEEKCGARFDVALLLSFVCTCLADKNSTVLRVANYLTDMPGLNQRSVAKEEARLKRMEQQRQRKESEAKEAEKKAEAKVDKETEEDGSEDEARGAGKCTLQ
jgi:hypothetical protein